MRTQRSRSRRYTSGIAVLLLLSSTLPIAALGPEEPHGGPLEPGNWIAVGTASGFATSEELAMTLSGEMYAQFAFSIDGSGVALGTWVHEGDSQYWIDGVEGGVSYSMEGDVTTSGEGTVDGSSVSLVLNGWTRTVGRITTTAAGFSSTFPVDTTDELMWIDLDLVTVGCDEAYGLWSIAMEEQLEDSGFTPILTGSWVALRETGLQVHLELRDAVNEMLDALVVDGEYLVYDRDAVKARFEEFAISENLAHVVADLAAFLQVFNEGFAKNPDQLVWAPEDLRYWIEEFEKLINRIRNLSECDKRHVGHDNLSKYLGPLTGAIQQFLTAGIPDGMTASEWQEWVQLAHRTGAVGAGAMNPEIAAAAEEALIAAGSEILDRYANDGSLVPGPEVDIVLGTGAAVGWTFDTAAGSIAPGSGSP